MGFEPVTFCLKAKVITTWATATWSKIWLISLKWKKTVVCFLPENFDFWNRCIFVGKSCIVAEKMFWGLYRPILQGLTKKFEKKKIGEFVIEISKKSKFPTFCGNLGDFRKFQNFSKLFLWMSRRGPGLSREPSKSPLAILDQKLDSIQWTPKNPLFRKSAWTPVDSPGTFLTLAPVRFVSDGIFGSNQLQGWFRA